MELQPTTSYFVKECSSTSIYVRIVGSAAIPGALNVQYLAFLTNEFVEVQEITRN